MQAERKNRSIVIGLLSGFPEPFPSVLLGFTVLVSNLSLSVDENLEIYKEQQHSVRDSLRCPNAPERSTQR